MNDWGGIISITGTTFDRFSNCGSIIRNYKDFLTEDTFDATNSLL